MSGGCKDQTSWNVKSSGPEKASLRTKLVEVMEFQWSYFKSWKMMLWKCCIQYVSKFGKLSSGHTLVKWCSKFSKPGFSNTWTVNFQMFKLVLKKRQRNQRSNRQHSLDHGKREFQKNIYFCFSDYAKAFDCVDHNKLWKILKEMGIPDHLTCLLRNLYACQLELDMEQQTGSK